MTINEMGQWINPGAVKPKPSVFRGICIGGPCAGRELEAKSSTFYVEVSDRRASFYSARFGDVIDQTQAHYSRYRYVYEMIFGIEVWVADGATPVTIIQELIANYAPNSEEKQRADRR